MLAGLLRQHGQRALTAERNSPHCCHHPEITYPTSATAPLVAANSSAQHARLSLAVLALYVLHQRNRVLELPSAVRAPLQPHADAARGAAAGRVERVGVEQQLLERGETFAALGARLARAAA